MADSVRDNSSVLIGAARLARVACDPRGPPLSPQQCSYDKSHWTAGRLVALSDRCCYNPRQQPRARLTFQRLTTMRTRSILALLSLCALLPASAPAADSDGWRTLLDAKSQDGWEHVGPGRMVTEDGAIRTEGGMGLFW